MAGAPTDRITRGGRRLSRRVWEILDEVGAETGLPIRVVQGSWSNGVRRSAGTHGGGGAFDLSCRGMTEDQQIRLTVKLRRYCGNSVWVRSPKFGWPRRLGMTHIHGIVGDEPGLAYGAMRQVINARDGLNGLANRGKDPFPRVDRVPFKPHETVTAAVAVRLANLQYGKRNDDVKDLQRALKITADGVYGPKTDAAVRAHQVRMGLTPDKARKSYVGPKQARALKLSIL